MKIEILKSIKSSKKESRKKLLKESREKQAQLLASREQSVVPLPQHFNSIAYASGNDLELLGNLKDVALTLLAIRLRVGKWRKALDLSGMTWDSYMFARKTSATYRKVSDLVDESIKTMRTALIEDKLTDIALGDVETREGYLPPDVKAANTFLQGNDDRYRPGATQNATQVVINLGGGIQLPGLNS